MPAVVVTAAWAVMLVTFVPAAAPVSSAVIVPDPSRFVLPDETFAVPMRGVEVKFGVDAIVCPDQV